MKKILVSCFIFTIILSLLGIDVNATETAKIGLSTVETAKKGEEIDLKIVVKGTETGIQGVQGTLKYDTDILEYVGNSSEKDGWKITAFNKNTGIFLAEITDVTDSSTFVHDESSIVSFKFKVKDTANKDETNINLSNIIAVGADSLTNEQETKMIKIQSASADNAGNDNNSTDGNIGNNENSVTNGNNTNSTTNKIPQTGREFGIYIVILINVCVSVFIYSCYKRYKEI